MFEVNYLAVAVMAVVVYVLGALWYSPMLFGTAWMKYTGTKESDMEGSNMPLLYFFGFLGTLVMVYVLAYFIDFAGATTWQEGFEPAFWLWLGFTATVHWSQWVWSNKSFNLFLINGGHTLVSMLLAGAVLAVWV